MSVIIGSARISETGRINGTKGDQTGNECSTQEWYLHSKGWYVLRPKSSGMAALIADCMQKICDNQHFGYGQDDRDDCLPLLSKVSWDPAKITVNVNIDCSLAVYVCCRYCGISIPYGAGHDFYTGNMKDVLLDTGYFDLLADDSHCKSSDCLKRGDILVTRTKGHTAVVLTSTQRAIAAGWMHTGDDWMYSRDGASYVTSEWLVINHHWYYFGADGKAYRGMRTIGSETFAFCDVKGSPIECSCLQTNSRGALVEWRV